MHDAPFFSHPLFELSISVIKLRNSKLCASASLSLSSVTHASVHEDDLENPKQVHYSAAPIISIIASIVVVFVMSLITGAGV